MESIAVSPDGNAVFIGGNFTNVKKLDQRQLARIATGWRS